MNSNEMANSFGGNSPLINLQAFLDRCRRLEESKSNQGEGEGEGDEDTTNTQTHSLIHSLTRSTATITADDERLLCDKRFVHALQTHNERYALRRRRGRRNDADTDQGAAADALNVLPSIITAPPQRCLDHIQKGCDTRTLAHHIRPASAADVDGKGADNTDINARGRGWDYRCAVVDVLVGAPAPDTNKLCSLALPSAASLNHVIDRIRARCCSNITPAGCILFDGVAYLDGRAGCITAYEEVFGSAGGVSNRSGNSSDSSSSSSSSSITNTDTNSNANTKTTNNTTDTPISSLPLRTGGVGIYIHNGNCEHTLQVTSVRLKATKEVVPRYKYIRAAPTHTKHLCDICNKKQAHFTTYKDKVGAALVSFWCPTCFDSVRGGEGGVEVYHLNA
ncbi:hypothetical protein E3P78_00848 [Wallemia ichthyophaga]|nr:hypothetical protein E3P78_00848 [Wallemia ichthyophaga]